MGELTGLDAVTIDAYGTLVELVDPVPALQAALAARGVERDPGRVAAAFRAEVAYYRPRSVEGRDAESLAALRRDCAGVFLREAGADLDPAEFAQAVRRRRSSSGPWRARSPPSSASPRRGSRSRSSRTGTSASHEKLGPLASRFAVRRHLRRGRARRSPTRPSSSPRSSGSG